MRVESIAWTPEALEEFDAALIATDHDRVDYDLLLKSVPFVVDTRNATAMLQREHEDRIVKA